jgi:hypothetical protein
MDVPIVAEMSLSMTNIHWPDHLLAVFFRVLHIANNRHFVGFWMVWR